MKKMLLVEDDDLSQGVMFRIFGNLFEIDVCESVEQYYEKFCNFYYDIIIMDISLKGKKDGFELTKEILSSPSYKGTPIICLTAHAHERTRRTAMEIGINLFLTKPIGNKELLEAVESVMLAIEGRKK